MYMAIDSVEWCHLYSSGYMQSKQGLVAESVVPILSTLYLPDVTHGSVYGYVWAAKQMMW